MPWRNTWPKWGVEGYTHTSVACVPYVASAKVKGPFLLSETPFRA